MRNQSHLVEITFSNWIAAALADVPIALVTLVDENRQWFKSCHGAAVNETSRETAFCAHVVASREIMLVPDALGVLQHVEISR